MRIGKFNKRITIEYKHIERGKYGDEIITWLPLATVWAEIKHFNGTEYFDVSQVISQSRTRFIMRYIPNLSVTMRVLANNEYYTIESINNYNNNNAYIELKTYRIQE